MTGTSNAKYTIYTDGGARGNPGPAAYGFVVLQNGQKICEVGREIGHSTNNIAEYMGVVSALQWVEKQQEKEIAINFFMDSELLANQLSGKWKIKNPGLYTLYTMIRELEERLKLSLTFTAVRREFNKDADRMVNLALDKKI